MPDDGGFVATHALPLYAAAMLFFHASEFALAAAYMRDELSHRNLLITPQYVAAMSAGLLEYWLEWRFAPGYKAAATRWLSLLGLAAVVAGEGLRKAAMLTARHNFTHAIKFQRRAGHTLVTWGPYAVVRHPGYLGWLLWAVGTQLLLGNALCALLFAAVAWRFFALRIPVEESTLREFFGDEWARYAARTPTYIPFIG